LTLKRPLKKDISYMLLPTGLLGYFDVITVRELGDLSTKKMVFHIQLEEKNQLPKCYNQSEFESKGFYPEKTIQDFPVRGKALYLDIKRRRWRSKDKALPDIKSDCSFIADGSKITKELSGFLKGTGRDPRRYDK
jgi:hypothetical protein